MPLKLQLLSDKGVQWVGWAKTRLFALTGLRKQMGLFLLKRSYALPGNIMMQIISSDICDIIRIWGGAEGFIFHPRNSAYPGGFTPEGDPILAVYGYPLVDDDHGSRLITGDTGVWGYYDDPPENYGNMDWIGVDGVVVSWRGPAGRLLPMDSLNSYPGFTTFDYETGGLLPVSHYTPYSNIVYQGGETLFEFPITSKVLGATDTYVILGVDYAGIENPDGELNGFYTEVWRGVDARIGYLLDSRPSAPWVFNPAGTEAASGGRRLEIVTNEDGTKAVAFSLLPTGSGTETKSIVPGGSWGLTRSGNYPGYPDFAAGLLNNINLMVASNDSSARGSGGSTTFDDFPILISGVLATSLLIIGPEAYAGPGAYTVTLQPAGAGDCGGNIVWTYPDPDSCGMGTVSAIKGGLSDSMQVRMPTGQWAQIYSHDFYPGSPPGTWYEATSGAYKTEEACSTVFNYVQGNKSCWSYFYNECRDSYGIISDGGYPPDREHPTVVSDIADFTETDCHDCSAHITAYLYRYVTDRIIYEWVCP